jgi:hypothetical protein
VRFVQFDFSKHAKWVKDLIKPNFTENTTGIVCVRDNGTPAGAVILDSWTANSVQGHLGAETPMVWRAGLHKEAFKYVFETAGRKIFLGLTPSDRLEAIRFHDKIGFKQVCRIPDGFADGIDYILYQMNKEDCRYI